jgi:hypothetical protein
MEAASAPEERVPPELFGLLKMMRSECIGTDVLSE